MRLITHNMLMCNKDKCTGGYPLRVELDEAPDSFKIEEQPVKPEFVRKMLGRLDYNTLYVTAKTLNLDLPPDYVPEDMENEHFINAVHHALFNYHVLEGRLVCPSCSHSYKICRGTEDIYDLSIKLGIPDMLHTKATG